MASGADARYGRVTIVVAVLALIVAAVATERARNAARPYTITLPPSIDFGEARRSFARLPEFWIGAWCPPPARATTAEAWTRFAEAGIDVGIYPLEDRYQRVDNLARLVLLDSLNQVWGRSRRVYTFVRDDSLHPDESLRPGWEGRLRRAVSVYRPYFSCAGIFLADEPPWETLPVYAPLARAFAHERDSSVRALPAFVNYVGLPGHPTLADRPRWRSRMIRSIGEAELPFFTVDSYAAPTPGGESPNFLLTLADAATVAAATGTKFGSLIQVTGHGHFPPATAAQARFRVFESLAHGATAIVWFTYWTPNPTEEPWRWREGLVEYATGEPTRQYEMVREVNAAARECIEFWGTGGQTNLAHLGGMLPAGADALALNDVTSVPGLRRIDGGPLTIAWRKVPGTRRQRYLIVNRNVDESDSIPRDFDHFELSFDERIVRTITRTGVFATATVAVERTRPHVALVYVPAGGAAGIEVEFAPAVTDSGRP